MDTNENNGSGRASYTDEDRRELMQEFHSSELTQAAFCREWNINPKTLARWLRIEREDREVSFCEVAVEDTSASENTLRVCLLNGIEVIAPFGSSEEMGKVFREAAQCLG